MSKQIKDYALGESIIIPTINPELNFGVKIATITEGEESKALFAPNSYLAFEAFPTDKEIPAGSYDRITVEGDECPEVTTDEEYKNYKNKVFKNTTNSKHYVLTANGDKYQWDETEQKSVDEIFDFENSMDFQIQYKN